MVVEMKISSNNGALISCNSVPMRVTVLVMILA